MMAKPRGIDATPPDGSDNKPPQRVLVWSKELSEKICKARDTIERIDKERELLNARRKKAVETCVAAGIPRAVLLREIKHAAIEPAKRIGEDEATIMVRYALGVPMSKDLLTLDMFAEEPESAPSAEVIDADAKRRAKQNSADAPAPAPA